MSEPFVFDSRCTVCKDPFGAIPCGQTVTFHCRPLASEQFTSCTLVLRHEFAQREEEWEMVLEGPQAERVRYGLTVSVPAEPELVWYYFRFRRPDGSACFLDRTGYRSDGDPFCWQMTVYRESHFPDWFGPGVTYQIFPDRFCRLPSDSTNTDGMVGNRWVHRRWNEMPEWRPDADGEIRNRDFFGGTLRGITSKLARLAFMGVTTLYLNPIFESASNHRYNTANYGKIDPLLGTEEDFRTLCRTAHELGMHVILDGVFNHTGSQSIYFNDDGFYSTVGASQSQDSPYFDWYSFHPWPSDYDSWWGIRTLPAVREDSPSYQRYIIDDEDAIIRRWLRCGADGWRLDVADELPDWFIEKLRTAVEETKPEALLIGEVWEDASNKIAYSLRRRYLLGSELHGVMNYPFRTALLAYLQGGDADDFRESMESVRENYPPAAFYNSMNFLGTHDTPRIMTVLGASRVPESKDARAAYRLSPAERTRGTALVKLAALILFSFPGSPTVYYGDELGLEGFEDPLNRGTYPWGLGRYPLLSWFQMLGHLRRERAALQRGEIDYLYTSGPILAFARRLPEERIVTVVNASDKSVPLMLPWTAPVVRDLLTGRKLHPRDGTLFLTLPPYGGLLLI